MAEGRSHLSSNPGRYAIGSPDGPDLTAGQVVSFEMGGQWVEGRAEYSDALYAVQPGAGGRAVIDGYYILNPEGGVCGLCVDMNIRTPSRRGDT